MTRETAGIRFSYPARFFEAAAAIPCSCIFASPRGRSPMLISIFSALPIIKKEKAT